MKGPAHGIVPESPADPGELDAILYELLVTPEGRADPYPRYAALRERAPVFRSGMGNWIMSRYADCQQVLRVPAFGKEDSVEAVARTRARRGGWDIGDQELEALVEFLGPRQSMLTLNPPDHTRLRGLVARAFTPSTVDELRVHVGALCDNLLDAMAARAAGGEEIDVMAELAFPLPVAVIGELLGVPAADRHQFQALVRATTVALEPVATPDDLRAARVARTHMEEYFHDLIDEQRRRPGPGLLADLIAVRDGTDQLSEDELIATAILLFAAGFETTTNLIGNGLLALLRHPSQLALARATARTQDAPAMARAVEELLRWDSPVQLDVRIAFDDVEVGGVTVAAGESVMTLLGAANRDPQRFTDPDVLDVARDEGPPMSFGAGIHFCLGAPLARMEGQVVFARLLERFSSLELCHPEVHYRNAITLRGLVDLPVALVAA
ncbi:MAG TPA: cytochrome P450 [Acidimicrobiales bacterium]|nr:cytochrome P450 [Acidimicrobiales bacterium]